MCVSASRPLRRTPGNDLENTKQLGAGSGTSATRSMSRPASAIASVHACWGAMLGVEGHRVTVTLDAIGEAVPCEWHNVALHHWPARHIGA
jgi:hypothetical protein